MRVKQPLLISGMVALLALAACGGEREAADEPATEEGSGVDAGGGDLLDGEATAPPHRVGGTPESF